MLYLLSQRTVIEDFDAVHHFLRARPDTTGKVAALGFSAGGHMAYLAATAFDLTSAVSIYGGWLTNSDIPLSQPEPTINPTPLSRTTVPKFCTSSAATTT